MKPGFVVEEKETKATVLIIDLRGTLGYFLARRFADSFEIVVVTKNKKLKELEKLKKIRVRVIRAIHAPVIPENQYSYVFAVSVLGKKNTQLSRHLGDYGQKTNAKIVYIEHYTNTDALIEHVKNDRTIGIVCGDIFGKGIPKDENRAAFLLHKALGTQSIVLSESGLCLLYPIYWIDAVDGILKAVFAEAGGAKLFYDFPTNPLTELSFLRTLQKIEPLLRVDFTSHKKQQDPLYFFQNGTFLFQEQYPLKDRLQKAFSEETAEEGDDDMQVAKRSSHLFQRIRASFFFLLAVIFFPFIASLLLFGIGGGELLVVKHYIETGEYVKAAQTARIAKKTLELSVEGNSVFNLELAVFGKNSSVFGLDTKMQTTYLLADAIDNSFYAFTTLTRVVKGESRDPKQEFVQATNALKSSLIFIEKTGAEKTLPAFLSERVKKFDKLISLSSASIDLLPSLFGVFDKKTYLILFQNNMELRPTGGFVGSYGLLTLDAGRVARFTIRDVYDADGKLKGHVEPPFALRRYMGAKHFFLRDSNFDISYPVSATTAAYFLNEETGEMVDGVIAVDLSFVKNILKSTGSIRLPDYNETITQDNLFEKTDEHAEKNFFPGSTQKKDFLMSLFLEIQNKLFANSKLSPIELLEVLNKSLQEKHILLASLDRDAQRLFSLQGVSAAIADERMSAENVLNDTIGINEANIGGNKVNYYVKRKTSGITEITKEGTVSGRLTLTLKNTSNGEKWGGDYKNYVRFILPEGSIITAITIDGILQKFKDAEEDPTVYENKKFKQPSVLEIERYNEEGKAIIGFLVIVPENTLKSIMLSYIPPFHVDVSKSSFQYNLRFIKQPGVDEVPFSHILIYPPSYKMVGQQRTGVFSAVLTKDTDIEFLLSQ